MLTLLQQLSIDCPALPADAPPTSVTSISALKAQISTGAATGAPPPVASHTKCKTSSVPKPAAVSIATSVHGRPLQRSERESIPPLASEGTTDSKKRFNRKRSTLDTLTAVWRSLPAPDFPVMAHPPDTFRKHGYPKFFPPPHRYDWHILSIDSPLIRQFQTSDSIQICSG